VKHARPRVGILGGGQLALMLGEALIALGADPAVYEPDADAPARRRYALGSSRPYEDKAALRRFLDDCDVVTYEFENVPAAAIRAAGSATRITPSLDVLEICQHRAREKYAIGRAGAPTVAHVAIADREGLREALMGFGLPAIVKTVVGGYDGKGQRLYRDASEVRLDDFPAGVALVIEEPLTIEREVSCIVARTAERTVSLPLFENRHTAHILDVTLCPARLPPVAERQARAIAERLARRLEVEGLLTVEMFLGKGRPDHGVALRGLRSRLYVNELAPRPHNSGHVSRVACDRSQFDLLARVLLGMALRPPRMRAPGVAFMANLIGDVWPTPDDEPSVFGALAADPAVRELYLYGKLEARPGRKMGHLSGFARSHGAAVTLADRLRRRARLSGPRSKR
jgi:5-(carboxyamino)imidazole ribonucleotide synthase